MSLPGYQALLRGTSVRNDENIKILTTFPIVRLIFATVSQRITTREAFSVELEIN